MPEALSPPDLANAVTSFSTIGAGITTLLLCWLVRAQPRRWVVAYACIFLTGLPTLGWHGWGTEAMRVADVGSNLLLAYALQLAVLGDFYRVERRRVFAAVSGLVNLGAVVWMVRESVTGVRSYAIPFGDHGGFYLGELVLILDSFAVVGLLYARRAAIPPAARPLLRLVFVTFLVGLGLATADGDVVGGRVFSYHALWHIVGGFGFVFFWAFNDVRFHGPGVGRSG